MHARHAEHLAAEAAKTPRQRQRERQAAECAIRWFAYERARHLMRVARAHEDREAALYFANQARALAPVIGATAARPRARGAGRPRAQAARRSHAGRDYGDDGPPEPAALRERAARHLVGEAAA
jgi:hypothetical protein